MAGTGQRDDPFAACNFLIDIDGYKAGFSEISGLDLTTDPIEYRNGNEDIRVRKLPGLKKFSNITLKRGVIKSDNDYDLTRACLVGCGVTTGWGSAVYAAETQPGDTVVVVGVAYDEQKVDAVPRLDYDERLDWMLTPSGAIRFA